MTLDMGLHEVHVRVGGWPGVCYVITEFSRMDSLPNFLTHGAPLLQQYIVKAAILINLNFTHLFLHFD